MNTIQHVDVSGTEEEINESVIQEALEDRGKKLVNIAERVYIEELEEYQRVVAQQIFAQLVHKEGETLYRRRISVLDLFMIPDKFDLIAEVVSILTRYGLTIIEKAQWTIEIAHDSLVHRWSRLQEWIQHWQYTGEIKCYAFATLLHSADKWQKNNRNNTFLMHNEWDRKNTSWIQQLPNWVQDYLHAHNLPENTGSPIQPIVPPASSRFRPRKYSTKLILEKHTESVRSATFTYDGQRIISVSRDATLRIWAMPSGQEITSVHPKILNERSLTKGDSQLRLQTVCVSPDNRTIAYARGRSVHFWDMKRNDSRETILHHEAIVWTIAFSIDGNRIVTACGDRAIYVWSINGRRIQKFEGHSRSVKSVALNPNPQVYDEFIAISGSTDRTVRLWPDSYRRPGFILGQHDGVVSCVSFSPNGMMAASSSYDGTARLWNIKNKELVHVFEGHQGIVRSVRFSNDNQMIATAGDDGTVRLWEVGTGQQLQKLVGHKASIWSVEFSPNNQYLVTASSDHTVHVWQVD